jgi:hypothetical protein
LTYNEYVERRMKERQYVDKRSKPHEKLFSFYRSDIGNYMHRWIFKHPFGTIRLHHILKSDNLRDLHDHPFDFISLLLTGGYREYTTTGINEWRRGSVVIRNAWDLHALSLEKPVWTLVFSSNYYRMWGFQTKNGWVPYTEYQREGDL